MKKLIFFTLIALLPFLSFGQVSRTQYLLDVDATIYTNGTHKIIAVADNALRKEEANSILFFGDSGTYYTTPYALATKTVTVPFGGTGKNSFTAYSLICAGTTSTGAMQNVSGVGTSGQILTSNGAGSLPTWQAVPSATVTAWGISGNSGIIDGTNFIGTTDNIPLNFKMNNNRSGRISAGTELNTSFGYVANYSNTSGHHNNAFGYEALFADTSGSYNCAFGVFSQVSNKKGNYNTAYGHNSLFTNVSGSSNTAIGMQSLRQTTGNRNTAIGDSSGYSNTGSDNVFLGYNAGWDWTGNNRGFIGNKTSDSLMTLDFNSGVRRVNINGSLKIIDGTQASGYVLTSDANGLASWQTPATPTYNWIQTITAHSFTASETYSPPTNAVMVVNTNTAAITTTVTIDMSGFTPVVSNGQIFSFCTGGQISGGGAIYIKGAHFYGMDGHHYDATSTAIPVNADLMGSVSYNFSIIYSTAITPNGWLVKW